MESQGASRPKKRIRGNAAIRREHLWMEAVDLCYVTPGELARWTGLTVRRIQQGIKRARGVQIDLETIWQIEWMANDGNTFSNSCDIHGGPGQEFPRGLPRGCLKCLRSGLDHLIHRPTKPPPEKEGAGTQYTGPPLTREKKAKKPK